MKDLAGDGRAGDIGAARELAFRAIADLTGQYNAVALDYEQARARLEKIGEMAQGREPWIETPDTDGRASDTKAALRVLDDLYVTMKADRDKLSQSPSQRPEEVRTIDGRISRLKKQKADTLLSFTAIELSLLRHRLTSLKRRIAGEEKKLQDINARTYALRQLEREKEIAEQNYLAARKTAEGWESPATPHRGNHSARLSSPAVIPLAPAYPRKGRIILVSALAGLVLGLAFAVARERAFRTFRVYEDVHYVLGVPLLLSSPLVTTTGRSRRITRLSPIMNRNGRNSRHLLDMTSMYDHFYKVLWKLLLEVNTGKEGNGGRSGVKENNGKEGNGKEAKERKPKKGAYVIAFAGCRPGDGASTMAFNFASAFAACSPRACSSSTAT